MCLRPVSGITRGSLPSSSRSGSLGRSIKYSQKTAERGFLWVLKLFERVQSLRRVPRTSYVLGKPKWPLGVGSVLLGKQEEYRPERVVVLFSNRESIDESDQESSFG